tara:strand:- start:54 stop:485 length:432 start_codon:yes stop_codon:yes gene_type:complete
MQKALESASYYTIHSGRKIVSPIDISMALKREMFIFMEREDIENKTNELLDEIELEEEIKNNLNNEDLEKFEELEEKENEEIYEEKIIDDEEMNEEWIKSECECDICVEINSYSEKFNNFEASNQFEKLVYNSIVNIDNQFNL